MIQWKQRLYAFFLRRKLSPYLNAASQRKLHESIEVSLFEGAYTLNNVGLCLLFLNSMPLGDIRVRKARIKSMTIHLSLVEEHAIVNGSNDGAVATSSLAWRVWNVGDKVKLVARVEIEGVELECEPLSKVAKAARALQDGSIPAPPEIKETARELEDPKSRGIIRSFFDAIMATLRLTVNISDLSVRMCQNRDPETTTWMEVRLPSIVYQNLDRSSSSKSEQQTSEDETGDKTSQTILEKSVVFQGISVVVGETNKRLDHDLETTKPASITVALMEGSGQISVLAMDLTPPGNAVKQIQHDIDIRLNQQMKVSVDEESLRRLLIIANGFEAEDPIILEDEKYQDTIISNENTENDNTRTNSENDPLGDTIDEMEHYTIEGITKQYEEARHLAERNEVRGGMLVPSSAFEEGDNVGEGDPRTFDVFFDANDKSFHHYASVMKESMLLHSKENGASDFVHAKIRFHLLGGGCKVSFRNPGNDAMTHLYPDEYILLKFSDLNVISSISAKSAEHSIHLSHMDIDDAQLEASEYVEGDLFHENKVEISNLLSFSQPEFDDDLIGGGGILDQSSCVSVHANISRDSEGRKHSDLEVNFRPCEVVYRHGTVTNVLSLLGSLKQHTLPAKNESSIHHATDKCSNEGQPHSVRCNLASVTVTLPVLQEVDCSALYERCGQTVDMLNNSIRSAVGVTFDNLTLEHRQGDSAKDNIGDSAMDVVSSLECNSLLVFVLTPDGRYTTFGRKMQRLDALAVTGRLEVDPCIPIAIEYRRNSKSADGQSRGKESFPIVPAFSSFKARQEDEDEDDEIDRMLSEKLHDVNIGARKALRAKDPQHSMTTEAANADMVVNMHIPEIVGDLSSVELNTLLSLLQGIIPNERGPKTVEENAHLPKPSIAVSIACDTLAVALQDKISRDAGEDTWSSHLLRLDRCRMHTVSGGESMKYIRFLSHETSLFEITDFAEFTPEDSSSLNSIHDRVVSLQKRCQRKAKSSAVPIFYRSKLLPAISHASPSLLLDVIQQVNEDGANDSEQSVYFSMYNMTYRYAPNSSWIKNLRESIASIVGNKSEPEQAKKMEETDGGGATSLTRVFVSLADCNLDYTTPLYFKTASRTIVRLGDLRFSSNLVSPAGSLQAFSLSIGDLSWYLSDSRYPYNFENSLLPGGPEILAPEMICYRFPQTKGSAQMSSEIAFRDMGFKTVLTLESLDAIIALKNPPLAKVEPSGNSSGQDPRLTISLTSGELSIYACKDSFQCFAGTVGELQAKMTALTDAAMEELRAKSIRLPCAANATEEERFYDAHSKLNIRDFAEKPLEYPEIYLLDGYDWTTIDHDSNHVTEIPPGEEQVARWYHTQDSSSSSATIENGLDSSDLSSSMISESTSGSVPKPNPSLRIIDQHFPLHVVSDPIDDGDMEASKLAGRKPVHIETRVLLHDMKVKIRLFDGYDWPESVKHPTSNLNGLFVIDEPVGGEKTKSPEKSDSAPPPSSMGKKSALLGGLLAGAPENESTFSDLPLPEERVKSLLTQSELRRLSRRTNSYLQFSANGVRLRMESYAESKDHLLNSCLNLGVGDFFFAETISNPKGPVKMMGEWFNESEHPRDTRDGLLMLKMINWYPASRVTSENEVASENCEVEVSLAPMRCILDQRAIKFAKAFFRSEESDEEEEELPDWATGLHFLPPPFLRMFRVKSVKLKIDYTPQQMDTAALKNGSIVELINISPLDAMVLTLNKVEIENVVGFGEAMGGLVGAWLADICATQMYKFLTNARPFEPLTSIGGGVADLFVLPWDAYKNGEKVSRAIRSSLSSLVGTVAHETLTTSSRLTEYLAGEMTRATSGSLTTTSNASQSSLPSRPLGTPKRVGDCASHALESLARGVQTANYKVIIVPYREYRRSGYRGAAKSVVKGIPIAVAAPMSGASEALSYTLLGARNQIRPDIRKEEEASQRGLHYGSR